VKYFSQWGMNKPLALQFPLAEPANKYFSFLILSSGDHSLIKRSTRQTMPLASFSTSQLTNLLNIIFTFTGGACLLAKPGKKLQDTDYDSD